MALLSADCVIRPARPGDFPQVHDLLIAAFGGDAESQLVELLRPDPSFVCEHVAEYQGVVAGEILFSRLHLRVDGHHVMAAALAPVAVLPAYQGQGIGARLIESGIAELRRVEFEAVIVVGHPAYYSRFEFTRETVAHLESPYQGDAFMGLELRPGALNGREGAVVYPNPFRMLED